MTLTVTTVPAPLLTPSLYHLAFTDHSDAWSKGFRVPKYFTEIAQGLHV